MPPVALPALLEPPVAPPAPPVPAVVEPPPAPEAAGVPAVPAVVSLFAGGDESEQAAATRQVVKANSELRMVRMTQY